MKRSYRNMWSAEEAAHAETKRRLVISDDLVNTFRQFLEAEKLQASFVAFMLNRHAAKPAK